MCAPTPNSFWLVIRTSVSMLSFSTGPAFSQPCVCMRPRGRWRGWKMMLSLQAISRVFINHFILELSILLLTLLCFNFWSFYSHVVAVGMTTLDWCYSLLWLSTHHALTLKPHDRFMAWTKLRQWELQDLNCSLLPLTDIHCPFPPSPLPWTRFSSAFQTWPSQPGYFSARFWVKFSFRFYPRG